jgi:hypothetical protein
MWYDGVRSVELTEQERTMTDELPDAPKQELTPEQKRGCAWFLILGIITAAGIAVYLNMRDDERECESRACPEDRAARVIDNQCICVVLPEAAR